MNEKFFFWPEEKQLAIINAGYRVFSRNSYKKSPVSEIAAEAGISKSLLFHYFCNKKELYLFLLDNAVKTTYEYLYQFECFEGEDIFEIMLRGLKCKVSMMRKYPDLAAFTLKAHYESDPEVCGEVQALIGRIASFKANRERFKINPEQYVSGLDIQMMYMDMYFASEGYIWERLQQGRFDIDEMEKDFIRLIEFWKKLYLKREDGQ